jgi:CheY-like chemotaxis protein
VQGPAAEVPLSRGKDIQVIVAAGPILLVEDDPDVRLMMATSLELEGASVITAANGAEAFNLARTHQPALIVLDLMMPVMSGEEFRRAQLANKTLSDIPVVVVSAHFDAPHIARRMKAIGCFMKPLDLEAFGVFVKKWCR